MRSGLPSEQDKTFSFILDLKKTVEEFYAQGTQASIGWKLGDEIPMEGTRLHFGVAKIFFDTDDNVNTGQRRGPDGPRGYEFELNTTLMAKSGRSLADWANAHVNMGKVNGHVLRCNLFRVPPTPGSGIMAVNQRADLSRES